MAALLSFRGSCYEPSHDPIAQHVSDLLGVLCEDPGAVDKQLGPGFRCLMAATCIKIVDLVCHALVPTPKERWTTPDPPVKDTAEYLSLASMPQQSDPESLASARDPVLAVP